MAKIEDSTRGSLYIPISLPQTRKVRPLMLAAASVQSQTTKGETFSRRHHRLTVACEGETAGVARGQAGLAGAALRFGQLLGQGQAGSGARTDRVGGDPVAAEVARQRAGQADDALLGCGVVGLAHVAQTGLGGGADDPPGALLGGRPARRTW